MPESFWSRPVEEITYSELVEFLGEGIDEADQLEYKMPDVDRNDGKIVYTKEFLETIVAYANSGGGLLICGVKDKPEERLPIAGIPAIRSGNKSMPALIPALRNVCQAKIEPSIYFDAATITIPPGEPHAGNNVLLVKVRPSRMPPHSHRDHGIWIRNYDRDQRATVAEIEALLARRIEEPSEHASYWDQVVIDVFAPATLPNTDAYPYVIVGLTPSYPIQHFEMNEDTDAHFATLGARLGLLNRLVMRREPHGVFLMPARTDSQFGAYARAFDDGSIGLRYDTGDGQRFAFHPLYAEPIVLLDIREAMIRYLSAARWWIHAVCSYRGSLSCAIAVSAIANKYAILQKPEEESRPGPIESGNPLVNWLPSWSERIEWTSTLSAKQVADGVMPSFARQMQYPAYTREVEALRDTQED